MERSTQDSGFVRATPKEVQTESVKKSERNNEKQNKINYFKRRSDDRVLNNGERARLSFAITQNVNLSSSIHSVRTKHTSQKNGSLERPLERPQSKRDERCLNCKLGRSNKKWI